MKQLKNFLKSSDIYGNIIGFKYEGNDRITSALGGCLTVCLLVISIIVLVIRFVSWSSNNYNIEIKTSSLNKNLTNPDIFNSTYFGFTLGILEFHKDGKPNTLGELNPIGDIYINQISLSTKPSLHEEQTLMGNIVNCYENNLNEMLTSIIKIQNYSFGNTFNTFLCSNISKENNITIGSDFIASDQSNYLEANIFFDICKVTPECNNHDALYTEVKKEFRLYFSLYNQFFDKLNYEGYKSAYSNYINHRLDFNKDLSIDIVVTKNIIITDPNKLFTFLPKYYNEYYSYEAVIRDTNRPAGLRTGDTIMNVNIVFREDDREVYIYRDFETIDNLLANTSTIIFAIYFVFKQLLFYFKKGNLTLSLLNKIYKFKEEDESKIDFDDFQSILGIGTILDQRSNANKQYNVKQMDHSLANLNPQNESQQDNPLRIEFKMKESSVPQKKRTDIKDRNNSSNYSVSNLPAEVSIQKPKTKRDVDDSKKTIIELPNIICAKNQDSVTENNNDEDSKCKYLPGLAYLSNVYSEEKFHNKLDIPKFKLFFFVCFGQCYRKNNLAANYYYVGKEFLNYDLNIEIFLKKAIEYESFKKLLLNDNHRKLLANYQRRKITKDNFAKTLNEMRNLTQFVEAAAIKKSDA